MNDKFDFKSLITEDFYLDRGHPLPMGTTMVRNGINFAIFSRHATAVTLVLFLPGVEEEIATFPLDSKRNRTGDIWHAFIGGLEAGIEYGYRLDGPEDTQHAFNPQLLMHDPR